MLTPRDMDRVTLRSSARTIALYGTGWATTAAVFAATVVIAFAAPI